MILYKLIIVPLSLEGNGVILPILSSKALPLAIHPEPNIVSSIRIDIPPITCPEPLLPLPLVYRVVEQKNLSADAVVFTLRIELPCVK